MESDLDALSKNNDPPSQGAVLNAQKLLLAPLKELEEIDAEIQRLEQHLKDLKAKRDVTQSVVKKYSSIISPARRLPSDILQEIFERCLPVHRNPVMSASEAPVLLTRICSGWRSIALSSPRLWARIHIPFSDMYRHSESGPPQGVLNSGDSVVETLQLRCHVVKEWLDRSGSCPLSVSILYMSSFWTAGDLDEADTPGNLTLALFRTLLLYSHRWQNLELAMPMEIYRKLEGMISVDTLSMLVGLKASFYQQLPPDAVIPDPFAMLFAPNLRKVSLVVSPDLVSLWKFPSKSNIWGHLTCVYFHSILSISETFYLLKHSSNLVHCGVIIMDYLPQTDDIQETVSLPHLQSLRIHEDINPFQMCNLYACIDAPQLTWIDYQRRFTDQDATSNFTPSPILSLVQKSTKLKKLTVDPCGLSSWNLSRLLQIASGHDITHLVLGHERIRPSELLTSRRFVTGGQDFDFSLLDCSGSSGTEIMLPRLQIFEATFGTNVLDKDLFRFITSRMDPFSPNGIAVLKFVRVMFSRTRGSDCDFDIVEEVVRRGHLVGVDMKLELNYLEEQRTSYVESLSSSCGLTEQGESWGYDEIEETTLPNSRRSGSY